MDTYQFLLNSNNSISCQKKLSVQSANTHLIVTDLEVALEVKVLSNAPAHAWKYNILFKAK